MCGRTAATGFDAWAPTYERSALQSTLYLLWTAQERALQFAQQLMPWPKRVLDIGCGTGRLLRQARQQYPSAMLVGVDVAWGWWRPLLRQPQRSWRSVTSEPPRSGCRLPAGCSTWWLPPCRCGTGQTWQPGSPRSTGCWPRVECLSWRTCSPPADAGACALSCHGEEVMTMVVHLSSWPEHGPDRLVQVCYPSGPVLFMESRPLAKEWIFRCLGAALASSPRQALATQPDSGPPKDLCPSGVFGQCTGRALDRIRTCGLLLRRQSLYPLSYEGWMLTTWGCGAYGTISPRLAGEWRNPCSGGVCYAPPGRSPHNASRLFAS